MGSPCVVRGVTCPGLGRSGATPKGSVRSLLLMIRPDDEGQCQALLVLVLAFLVRVAGAANRVPAEEQDLGDPLIGVNLRGQRGCVADLDRDFAAPFRLQGRYIANN